MSADGSTADFTLIILDKGDGKFFTFATNASIKTFRLHYKARSVSVIK